MAKKNEKDQVEADAEKAEAIAAPESESVVDAAGAGNDASASTDDAAGDVAKPADDGGVGGGADAGITGADGASGAGADGAGTGGVDGEAAETVAEAGEGEAAQGAGDTGQAGNDPVSAASGGDAAVVGGTSEGTGGYPTDDDAAGADVEWPLDANGDAEDGGLGEFIDAIRADTANVMSAFCAGCSAFSKHDRAVGLDPRWLAPSPSNAPRMLELAAAFLRKWPDNVNPDAIVIHLRRSGFSQVPKPGPREAIAWKVFAFTLAELDRLDREEAARREAEKWAEPGVSGVMSREDLAFAPQENNARSDLGR